MSKGDLTKYSANTMDVLVVFHALSKELKIP
jgi:hypothetical protein